MAKEKFLTEADMRKAKLDTKLKKLAASGNWDKVVSELDRKAKDGEYFCGNRLLKLCRAND